MPCFLFLVKVLDHSKFFLLFQRLNVISPQTSIIKMSETFNPDLLKAKLADLKCDELRGFIRSSDMKINGLSRIAKPELVRALVRHLQTPRVAAWLYSKDDAALKYARETGTHKDGYLRNYQPSREEMIVYRLRHRHRIMSGKLDQIYSDRAGQCTAIGQKAPKFGAGVDNDCPRGYAMLDSTGCCANLESMVGLWPMKDINECHECTDGEPCDKCDDLSPTERIYMQSQVKSANENTAALKESTFRSARDAETTLGFVAELQKLMIAKLGAEFDQFMSQVNSTEEMCDMNPHDLELAEQEISTKLDSTLNMGSKIAGATLWGLQTLTFGSISVMGMILWKLLAFFAKVAKGVMWVVGNVYTGVKTVTLAVLNPVWSVSCRLASAGQKLAWFIMTNPAQARMLLTVAKGVKKGLCRYIGSSLSQSMVLAALEHRMCQSDLECSKNRGDARFVTLDRKVATELSRLSQSVGELAKKLHDSSKVKPISQFMYDNGIGLYAIVVKHWDNTLLQQFWLETAAYSQGVYEKALGWGSNTLEKATTFVSDMEKADKPVIDPYYQTAASSWAPPAIPRTPPRVPPVGGFKKPVGMTDEQLQREREKMIHKMTEEEPTWGIAAGWFNSAVASVRETAANTATSIKNKVVDGAEFVADSGLANKFMQNIVNNDKVKAGFVKAGKIGGATLGGMMKGIPVFGGGLSAFMGEVGALIAETTVDSMSEVTKLYIMKSDMTHSFQLVLEILDLETCLMEMTEVQRRFPLLCARIILSKRLAAEYAAARLGATVMDIQKSLTDALDEDIKLVK